MGLSRVQLFSKVVFWRLASYHDRDKNRHRYQLGDCCRCRVIAAQAGLVSCDGRDDIFPRPNVYIGIIIIGLIGVAWSSLPWPSIGDFSIGWESKYHDRAGFRSWESHDLHSRSRRVFFPHQGVRVRWSLKGMSAEVSARKSLVCWDQWVREDHLLNLIADSTGKTKARSS